MCDHLLDICIVAHKSNGDSISINKTSSASNKKQDLLYKKYKKKLTIYAYINGLD